MTLYWFCESCKGWYRTIPPYYEYEGGQCFECRVIECEGWKPSGKPCDYRTKRRK